MAERTSALLEQILPVIEGLIQSPGFEEFLNEDVAELAKSLRDKLLTNEEKNLSFERQLTLLREKANREEDAKVLSGEVQENLVKVREQRDINLERTRTEELQQRARVRTDETLRLERERQRIEQEAKETQRTQRLETLEDEIKDLRSRVEKGTISEDVLGSRLQSIESENPQKAAVLDEIRSDQAARIETTRQTIQNQIRERFNIPSDQSLPGEITNAVTSEIKTSSPREQDVQKIFRQAEPIVALERELRSRGLDPADVARGRIRGKGLLANLPFVSGGGETAAAEALESFRRNPSGSAGKAVSQTLKGLRGARLGRLGIAGGAAALLAALFSRDREDQSQGQQLPPLLQLQLMQQLGELENNNLLTQSLVQSRGAAADRNQAQADLTRAKLLQLMGASGGGL